MSLKRRSAIRTSSSLRSTPSPGLTSPTDAFFSSSSPSPAPAPAPALDSPPPPRPVPDHAPPLDATPTRRNPTMTSSTPALHTARLSMVGSASPDKKKMGDKAAAEAAAGSSLNAKNVATPGELCGFVDTLLNSLEERFDAMSEQVLSRMTEMSTRIDNLETAIADLMQGGVEPASPTPPVKKNTI
ncbi:hypothetical protein Q8F55_007162 [Vanrija albida]|uniref:Heat shock factor-binding protein 1 n=1 Tax=Vanrija albida TaxID=181172 RepID=A0ABR3PZ56_9TREE